MEVAQDGALFGVSVVESSGPATIVLATFS
jgi:hypothetical protein